MESTDTSNGDEYPPDAEDFDPMDLQAEDMPSSVPRPRSAGVRQQMRQQQAVARPKSKAKPAKRVKKGGGSKLLAQQRRRQALELRKAGASYQDIASGLGYHDQSGARKAVIKAFGEVIHEPVAELRTLQTERLNHMLMTLWPRVQQGDDSAIRTSLAVMDKMDRLQGTEQAPAPGSTTTVNQTGILVIDGNKDDYIAQMRKMAGIDANGHNILAQQGSPQAQQVPLGQQLPQITQGPQYPPGMTPAGHEVVDAELVEDTAPEPQRDDSPPDPVRTGEPAHPTKKKFSFGVDPTVRRDKQ
jgi:AraC-like DNA-binding protein